jgi:hypothetical protein
MPSLVLAPTSIYSILAAILDTRPPAVLFLLLREAS